MQKAGFYGITDIEVGDKVTYRDEYWKVKDIRTIFYVSTCTAIFEFLLTQSGNTSDWVSRDQFKYPCE